MVYFDHGINPERIIFDRSKYLPLNKLFSTKQATNSILLWDALEP